MSKKQRNEKEQYLPPFHHINSILFFSFKFKIGHGMGHSSYALGMKGTEGTKLTAVISK